MIELNDVNIEPWPTRPTGGMQTGEIPNGIKITHIKTGITITCVEHRSQHRNRQSALEALSQRLTEE